MIDLLNERRARVAAELGLQNELLVIGAGHPVPLPENSDQFYPFICHADYSYLGAATCAGAVLAFDPQAPGGEQWIDFVPRVTEAERIWEGMQQSPGHDLEEFDAWLRVRKGRPLAVLGSGLRSLRDDAASTQLARTRLQHARRPKDACELALLRRAATATAAGYEQASAFLRPGVSERMIQIELESAFYRSGASQTGFASIVASGPNSAILHFTPGERRVAEGDFVLIDSGAQIGRYTADVTRTLIVGTPSPFQQDLYQLVLHAQKKAIERCRPGNEWKEVHLFCAAQLCEGLVSMGILRGKAESLVEQEAHALFFPHGVGHLVGLGVRDASGTLPGREPDPRPCLQSLRMDLPLEENYVVTVEPGLYFIPPLLNDPKRRSRFKDHVNWELVDRHQHLGGVRIEDDILVRREGPEVLTAIIPK